MSIIAHVRPDLITKIFHKSSQQVNNTNGQYVLMFYKYRVPYVVVIDDFFPTNSSKMYPYAQIGVDANGVKELWPILIEKAYAKFIGSFPDMEGGYVSEALENLTNGVPSSYIFASENVAADIQSGKFWKKILTWRDKRYLMGAGSNSGKDTDISTLGIVQGHAYSILDAMEIDGAQILQLRNPWGDSTEWKGAWADGSADWTEARKQQMIASQQQRGVSQ